MRRTVPWVAGGMAVGTLAAFTIGRDWAYTAAAYATTASYVIVAASLFPLALRGTNPLAPALFLMSIGGAGMTLYGALFVSLHRPDWMFSGPGFLIFLAFAGEFMAAVAAHALAIGTIQHRRRLYLWLLVAALLFGMSMATLTFGI